MMTISKDQAMSLRQGLDGCDRSVLSRRLRCISVCSGKGGVGKTMISVGLAFWLARMKYKVLVIDGDLGLANVDIQMGLDPRFTLQDVVLGHCSLADTVMRVEGGPDVLPSASGAPEMVDMGNARREMFVSDLMNFAGNYDFILIDVGAGIGKGITAFLQVSSEVLVVVANEPTSIMDAYSLIKILRKSKEPPPAMIVANMVRSLDEGDLLAQKLNKVVVRFLGIELPLAGTVVYDESVKDAVRARCPVVSYANASAASKCIKELAERICLQPGSRVSPAEMKEVFFEKLADLGLRQKVEGGQ
ncbi:MAG: hypothetical protein A2283_05445 [Lentisphaerae bacterium RIFOXYA12_FULL_48_11]|nr:MAG: hypothetical protein A2283_05445 [Lentisphaerae bacterium RIFOXYA12_FULL_48_11]